ncbi:helix-turn-helix transcriptional regulator [Mesorhizobium sp. KR1-2]|uniref:helix-turn-helix domain-containing protein n=1 Tax=Mesorhizobium sp. KR1-2 TaxID=3156609 RepID=UPI0032B4EC31
MKVPYQLLWAARVALDKRHDDLAKEAGVSERTLVRFETPQSVSADSLERVRAALEAWGVKFLAPEGGHGPGMRIPENTLEPPSVRRHEPGRRTDSRK